MKKKLKILLLEDNASDVKLLNRALSKSLEAYELKVIETKEEYLDQLAHPYDIVISDFALPAFDGMEALKIRNKTHPFLPFIITTGSMNEATAVQCMKEGADDYIIKEHITRIGEAVKRAIALKKTEHDKLLAFHTVQHLNRMLKAIRNINQLITREHDEQKLIQQACDMFTAEESYNAAMIVLFDDKGNLGKTSAFSGIPKNDFLPFLENVKKGDWPPCFRMAAGSEDMVHIAHSEKIVARCPLGKLKLSSSSFSRILTYNKKKFGFITVSVPDDVTVNREEKELFREVTGDLAYALFNMQVEREGRLTALRQKVLLDLAHAAVAEENTESFLSKVFHIIRQVVDFQYGYVAIHDPQRGVYTFPKQYRTENIGGKELPDSKKGLIDYVRKRRKLTVLTDTELKKLIDKGEVEQIGPVTALWMGIPLISKEKFIGVMAFMNDNSRNAFSKKDEELLGFLSHQLALFIDRKKSEEKIRQLSLGVEQSPASIVITDLNGTIQYVNKKFTEVSGYSSPEALGQNPRILKSGKMPDKLYRDLWATISSGKEWQGEMINRRKDHSLFWELVSISPVKDAEGNVTHYIAVKEDITARKEMEAELRRAKQKAEESNKLKSEFLANMSHEIRTPMNGIIGFASLLEEEDLTAETRQNYVQIIQNSTRQLLHIIDEILEVSKLQTHQVEKDIREVNINELLLGCFSEQDQKAKNKNIPLYIKKGLPDEAARIRVDEKKLHRVLHNLVENAVKFTQEGYVEMGYRLKGNKLEFYVKDTGIGISPDAKELIFDEFSQEDKRLSRTSGGLGLGLSIVKGNVELLDGSIRVESEKGKGSTFFVEIPYLPASPGMMKLLKQKAAAPADRLTVLVTEDEEVNYQYLEILLKKYNRNIEILHAISGEQAVELCSQHPEVRLVLMDLKMPGMGGLEATRRIKGQNPGTVVVAQTAYTSLENQEGAKMAGCDAFLRKPTRKADLFKVLEKYLRER